MFSVVRAQSISKRMPGPAMELAGSIVGPLGFHTSKSRSQHLEGQSANYWIDTIQGAASFPSSSRGQTGLRIEDRTLRELVGVFLDRCSRQSHGPGCLASSGYDLPLLASSSP